jgi:prepilin-type N-terminal cleavage/methylation domain-containing protein
MNTRRIPTQLRSAQRAKKGFTLTEIAIVLGIIGMILGAIWVAASSVYNSQKVSRATTEVLAVSQAVRALFPTNTTTGIADGDITTMVCNAGVFPQDMVSSCATPTIYNPWSGSVAGTTVAAISITAAAADDGFEIIETGVSSQGCYGLITAVAGSGRDSGLFYAKANTAYAAAGATNLPVTAATSGCATGNANTVYLVFKVHG